MFKYVGFYLQKRPDAHNLYHRCVAAHCNTQQHTATHCNTLQHTWTHSLSQALYDSVLPHMDESCPVWMSHVPYERDVPKIGSLSQVWSTGLHPSLLHVEATIWMQLWFSWCRGLVQKRLDTHTRTHTHTHTHTQAWSMGLHPCAACENNDLDVDSLYWGVVCKWDLTHAHTHTHTGMVNGFTPLFAACENNDLDVAKILVEAGADTNAKSRDGVCVWCVCCECVCLCVCVWERERERVCVCMQEPRWFVCVCCECVCLCVCESERERERVCVCKSRDGVCVCVVNVCVCACVCERERVCVCVCRGWR